MYKKAWCARAEVLVVYHLRAVFAKYCWKVNGKRVIPAENFREQRKISKRSPVFSWRDFPNGNSCTISLKPTLLLVSGFRGSFSVNGTDFLQMVNTIPGGNVPVLNFAYHLPKPWTDQFAHVSGKQPLFCQSKPITIFLFSLTSPSSQAVKSRKSFFLLAF